MTHQHAPDYHEPEHFRMERHHAGLIAAWAIGLLVVLMSVGLLASRVRADQQPQTGDAQPPGISAGVR